MAASICVTVVFPLLPVTAIMGTGNCMRQAWASAPNANRVSFTTMQAMRVSPRRSAPGLQIAATAPRCSACKR